MTTEQLLDQIRETIYANGSGAITGPVLQGVLLQMAGLAGPVDVGDLSAESSLDAALSSAAFGDTVGGIPRAAVLRGSYVSGGNRVAVLVMQSASGSQLTQLRLFPSSGGASLEARWCPLPATADTASWSAWEAVGGGGGSADGAVTDITVSAEAGRLVLSLNFGDGTGTKRYLPASSSEAAGVMTAAEFSKLDRAAGFHGDVYSDWDALLADLKLSIPQEPAFWVQVGSSSYLVQRCQVGSGLTAYHYFFVLDTFSTVRYVYYRNRTDGSAPVWSGWQSLDLSSVFRAVTAGSDAEGAWLVFSDAEGGSELDRAELPVSSSSSAGVMSASQCRLLTGLDSRVGALEQGGGSSGGGSSYAVLEAAANDTGRTVETVYESWDAAVGGSLTDARVEWQRQMDEPGGSVYPTGRFWLVATNPGSGTGLLAFAAWPELDGIHASTCYNQRDATDAAARTDTLFRIGGQTYYRDGFQNELTLLFSTASALSGESDENTQTQ